MINLIIDILIYNYTNCLSFFFLVDLNKRSLLINICIGLLVDYILNIYFFNVIFIIIIYIITKLLKFNINNFFYYYLYNLFIILLYYIISNLLFNYINIYNLLNVLLINTIFIYISYKKEGKYISFFR